jgi:MFS family permease
MRVGLLALAGTATTFGTLGLSYLVSLHARDNLGVSATGAGLVLLAGGLTMLVTAPQSGRVIDRMGAPVVGALAVLAGSAVIAGIGRTDRVITLVALWAVASAGSSLVLVAIQSLATAAIPENRGGAVSVVLAFRFAGLALSPLVWIPVFETNPINAFQGAALVSLPAVAALAVLGRMARAERVSA